MTTMTWRKSVAIALGLALGTSSMAYAQEHHEHGGDHGGQEHGGPGRAPEHFDPGAQHYSHSVAPPHQFLDNRYNHGHYYYPHGYVVHDLPGGYRPYFWHGSHYYFSGGIWYAPGPGGFVVVGPPAGLFVATLPAFYTTLWFGGVPYYYANDVYYQWNAPQNGYVVVNAPPGADQPGQPPPEADGAGAPPGAPPPADDVFIYPKNGQSQEQQAADRFECHDWAKNQTGFDPTQPGGGVAPGDNASRRDRYQRAMGACLEARGYTVK